MILHTWVVEGIVFPVVVTSASMAPTLLGVRREATCSACGFRFACGTDHTLPAGAADCPNCGSLNNDLADAPELSGDRLLIDRSAFAWRSPRRWEVVAFRHPERARTICVKRVVGLPGEEVQICGGDVCINGRIVRKSLEQQRAMAILVHDADHESPPGAAYAPAWQGEPNSDWKVVGGVFRHPSSHPAHAPTKDLDWCRYRHWQHAPGRPGMFRAAPVDDDLGYDRAWGRRMEEVAPVGDLMLSFRAVRVAGAGRLAVRACDGAREFLLTIDPAARRYAVSGNGEAIPLAGASGPLPVGDLQSGFRLEVSLFDRQFLAAVDGRTLVAYPYGNETASELPGRGSTQPLAIGCAGLEVELREVRVFRDVYYGRPAGQGVPWGFDRPCRLGEDEFFVLGDNSAVSEDSRTWVGGPGVPWKLLYGRPFLVHLPSQGVSWGGWRFQLPDFTKIRYIR